MPMGVKPPSWLYAVFVDHQQIREPHVLRVIVTAEGKAVLRAQPTQIGEAALSGGSEFHHVHILSLRGGRTGESYWPGGLVSAGEKLPGLSPHVCHD